MGWLPWVAGGALLAVAGFAVAYLPTTRTRRGRRHAEWTVARAAIDSAAVSRDAAPHDVPAAQDLLARAEALAAAQGGVTAAREAAHCATRADHLWREAAGG